jgi:hypothetical protein
LTALLDDIVAGAYRVEELLPGDYPRVRDLCDTYADSDIGFVDAAVFTIAERLGEPKLVTPWITATSGCSGRATSRL